MNSEKINNLITKLREAARKVWKGDYKPIPINYLTFFICLFNALLFNIPFYRITYGKLDFSTAGIVLAILLVLLPFVLNYIIFYLLSYSFRKVGRWTIALIFICNSFALYFINKFNAMLDMTMMGNLFNTNVAEAKGFWSAKMLMYFISLGVIPSILIIKLKINYGSFKKFTAHIGCALALLALLIGAAIPNWRWIHNQSGIMGSKILPWSYIVNSVRYYYWQKDLNRPIEQLPDIVETDSTRSAVILIIGESARRDHFSLYGYERPTNPKLELLRQTDSLKLYNAVSNATYTIAGVRSILEPFESKSNNENLPTYLYRQGIGVEWRSNNDGVRNLKIDNILNPKELRELYPDSPEIDYDGLLTEGLASSIQACDSTKLLVVLHTNTSHGPTYSDKYPKPFEKWKPVPSTANLSDFPIEIISNAYDNTILYLDHVIDRVISEAKKITDRKVAVIYISDHGESLGEDGIYMHGLDMFLAPSCQYEIPFIVWTNDPCQKYAEPDQPDQHCIFHSIVNFLGLQTPLYQEDKNIFIK